MLGDIKEHCIKAKKIADEQEAYFTGPLGNDVFQCSPMPWVTYTHISHTNSGKKDNATPLFDWGKFYEKDGRILMPVSVQAHHSFVDGIYIGEFVDVLKKILEFNDRRILWYEYFSFATAVFSENAENLEFIVCFGLWGSNLLRIY